MNCEHEKEAYQCPICKQCFQCKHRYHHREDGWWVRCPIGRWMRAWPKHLLRK